MSDTEKAGAGGAAAKSASGWTDKERLVYLFALIEQTGVKMDFKNTPRPTNRSEIACQRMVERLKTTIKDELEALKSGTYGGEPTTAAPKKSATPAKRKTPAKAADSADADGEGSPKKRGRKPKAKKELEAAKADEMKVKTEAAQADELGVKFADAGAGDDDLII